MRSSLIFLAHLDDSDLAWLQEACRKHRVAAGTIVIDSGVVNEGLYLLLDGRCRVEASDGRFLDALRSGDIIGEVSFVDRRQTTARVTADGSALLAHYSAQVLQDKLSTDLAFASRFFRGVASVLAYRLRFNLQATIRAGVDVLDSAQAFAGEVDLADLEVTARSGARLNHLLQALA